MFCEIEERINKKGGEMQGCQSVRKGQRRQLFQCFQRAEWEETHRRSENKSRRGEFNIFARVFFFFSVTPSTLTKASVTPRKSENMTNLIALAFLQRVFSLSRSRAERTPRQARVGGWGLESGISPSHLGRDKTRQDPPFQRETLHRERHAT